jgi:hypothetical protein
MGSSVFFSFFSSFRYQNFGEILPHKKKKKKKVEIILGKQKIPKFSQVLCQKIVKFFSKRKKKKRNH